MKITHSELKKLIKEVVSSTLKESAFTITPEQKKFADEIIDAAVNKTKGREPMLQDLEAIRTVIKFKLAQEGWTKGNHSSGGEGSSHEDFLRTMRGQYGSTGLRGDPQ